MSTLYTTAHRPIALKSLVYSKQARKTDFHNRTTDLHMVIVAGFWNVHNRMSSYSQENHAFSIEFHLNDAVAERLRHEVLEHLGLNALEDPELILDQIRIDLEPQRDWDREYSFKVLASGAARHSRVMWDPLPYTVHRNANAVICAIVRDILLEHMGADIGEYPRREL